MIRGRPHYWRQGAQPPDYDFRLVQLTQVRVTSREKTIRQYPSVEGRLYA